MRSLKTLITSLSLAIFLAVSLPGTALANPRNSDSGRESGDDVAIILDLVILRPIGLVATVAGVIIFVPSLIISIPTGSVRKTFNALVAEPAAYTFWRTLGDEK